MKNQNFMAPPDKTRCTWCGTDPLYMKYHDEEWGVPVLDDQKLFEMINLEGAQAGLSWLQVLKRRADYRAAFENFDPLRIALYSDDHLYHILQCHNIIRNRLKVYAVRTNARAFLEVQKTEGSFSGYLWRFVGGAPRINAYASLSDVPATTPESDAMSADLKKRGFKFVGSTICHAFMQAVGMVNDHTTDCFRYDALKGRPGEADQNSNPTPI
jgi:DNA-3-methyladenine glycosylase I